MPKSEQKPSVPQGEHIFHETEMHMLALQWKELNAQGLHDEAMPILERIIEGSTKMFRRFAQHEKYVGTVDLDTLVSDAQDRVVKWLLKWDPRKGKLFTFFTKCAKHAFLSRLSKENIWRRRFHTTSDSLENFIGTEDHAVDRHDMTAQVHDKLSQISCRWGSPQELGAIRYLIDCIIEDNEKRDKSAAIRGAVYAWGISYDLAKFFHRWALSELRAVFYECVRFPIQESDLFLLAYTYDHIADFKKHFGWDFTKKFLMLYGGSRFYVPPIAKLAKLKRDYRMSLEFERCENDPEAVSEIAHRYKLKTRTATEAYAEMVEILKPERSGDHSIYGDNPVYGDADSH
jgi:hypothetical protein